MSGGGGCCVTEYHQLHSECCGRLLSLIDVMECIQILTMLFTTSIVGSPISALYWDPNNAFYKVRCKDPIISYSAMATVVRQTTFSVARDCFIITTKWMQKLVAPTLEIAF